ncbi:hypothetical protein JHK87_034244 [Glycine soja]|nr:hypothetical protein JHK87_034244 [Glycine soja]
MATRALQIYHSLFFLISRLNCRCRVFCAFLLFVNAFVCVDINIIMLYFYLLSMIQLFLF